MGGGEAANDDDDDDHQATVCKHSMLSFPFY